MKRDNIAIFLIWFTAALLVTLFLTITRAEAGAHTMHLVDEYIDNGVKICVYSDGRHWEKLERNRASSCPSVHTFYD